MTLAKGYDCRLCGKFNRFSSWVYAHWSIEARHVCECGQEALVKRGIVLSSKRTRRGGASKRDGLPLGVARDTDGR